MRRSISPMTSTKLATPPSILVSNLVLAIVQKKFAGNRHAFAHGVDRVAAFIGELRNLNNFIDRRGGFDVEKITESPRGS